MRINKITENNPLLKYWHPIAFFFSTIFAIIAFGWQSSMAYTDFRSDVMACLSMVERSITLLTDDVKDVKKLLLNSKNYRDNKIVENNSANNGSTESGNP